MYWLLHWCHNDHDGVSNHQPHGCLLNRLFRRRSKKTSKLRVTGLCVGNSPGPVNSPHKGPVTRKMFPFDDVIMKAGFLNVYIATFLSVKYTPTRQKLWHILSCPLHNKYSRDGFFHYLTQMITSMRGCVTCNDLWPWHISSRLFSCDVAHFMDYIHLWHNYNM